MKSKTFKCPMCHEVTETKWRRVHDYVEDGIWKEEYVCARCLNALESSRLSDYERTLRDQYGRKIREWENDQL